MRWDRSHRSPNLDDRRGGAAPGGGMGRGMMLLPLLGRFGQRGALAAGGDGDASVAVELQADCLAGVRARSAEARGLLEAGDLAEALDAAAAIGDDAIQRRTTGRIDPESWTHGSSEQRAAAFEQGYRGGTPAACGIAGGSPRS